MAWQSAYVNQNKWPQAWQRMWRSISAMAALKRGGIKASNISGKAYHGIVA